MCVGTGFSDVLHLISPFPEYSKYSNIVKQQQTPYYCYCFNTFHVHWNHFLCIFIKIYHMKIYKLLCQHLEKIEGLKDNNQGVYTCSDRLSP